MSVDKKEKKDKELCNHHFIVTGWMTKGGHKQATQMRCVYCLCHKSLEELESKEFAQAQGFA